MNTMEHLLTNKAQIFTGPTETDDKESGPADAALEAADVVEEAEALDDHGSAAAWDHRMTRMLGRSALISAPPDCMRCRRVAPGALISATKDHFPPYPAPPCSGCTSSSPTR